MKSHLCSKQLGSPLFVFNVDLEVQYGNSLSPHRGREEGKDDRPYFYTTVFDHIGGTQSSIFRVYFPRLRVLSFLDPGTSNTCVFSQILVVQPEKELSLYL